ncbi:MAG: NAD-dependent epimerase/dehydratase family protein [candidate division Zixibacteria bacterium]|nr:NAD-dependent epimerase/dehydratase family protein [candidate division Zixibacteria bacterium]
MKIFITGATGFIGTHVVRRLAQTQHKMFCLARKTSDVTHLKELGATLTPGDVTDKESLLKGMIGCDWVVNLANLYSFWESDRKIYTKVNIEGTRNIMESALEKGISKVVHISTAGIFGKPADCPFTEDSTVGPVQFSEYSRTKYEGDLIAWELYEKKKLPLVMVYPGAVLGPGDPKTTGKYIKDLMGRKLPATVFNDSIMTFVHVRDVAETIVRATEKENNIGEKYLAGKYQLTFGEINKMISEISSVPLPKISLPSFLVMVNAKLLTSLANLIKKPPIWGMSVDQMKVMKESFRFDGSKAERELGITYTPIRIALEEAIASYNE